jgi:DNA-binding transcriptional regulator YiaG
MRKKPSTSKPSLESLLAAPDARKRGEDHHSAKLTPSRVATIREALARGVAPATLARAYGVSRQTVADIRDGKTWKTG